MNRRQFLMSAAGAGLALNAAPEPSGKPLRGMFPIAQTPFTAAGALDVETLVRQLEFTHGEVSTALSGLNSPASGPY